MVRDQWVNLARMPGLYLYSFSKDILGFLMTTESQDLGLTNIKHICFEHKTYVC